MSIHALTSLFPDISQDILQLYLNDCKGDLERTVNVVLDAKKSNSLKTLSPKCSPAPASFKIANDDNDDDDNNNNPIKKSEFSVKGDAFNYVESEPVPPGSDLECSLCIAPLFIPTEHTCGKMYCRACIAMLKKCPNCEENISHGVGHAQSGLKTVTLKLVLNTLATLKVVCINCKEGVVRDSLPQHLKSCPVKCESCEVRVDPQKMSKHLENDCKRTIVPCPAKNVFCVWRGSRTDVDEHAKACAYATLQPVLEHMIGDIAQLKMIVEDLRQEQQSMRSQLIRLNQKNADHSRCNSSPASPAVSSSSSKYSTDEQKVLAKAKAVNASVASTYVYTGSPQWRPFAEQLRAKGLCKVAVCGKHDGAVWTESGFNIQILAVSVLSLVNAFNNNGEKARAEGIRFGGHKFALVLCDDSVLYAHAIGGVFGLVVKCLRTCVVIGVHDRSLVAGKARQAIEYMGDYLTLQGF